MTLSGEWCPSCLMPQHPLSTCCALCGSRLGITEEGTARSGDGAVAQLVQGPRHRAVARGAGLLAVLTVGVLAAGEGGSATDPVAEAPDPRHELIAAGFQVGEAFSLTGALDGEAPTESALGVVGRIAEDVVLEHGSHTGDGKVLVITSEGSVCLVLSEDGRTSGAVAEVALVGRAPC